VGRCGFPKVETLAVPNALKADLLLVCATLLAGFGWLFSKEVLDSMSPILFIGLRFLLAGLILLPFSWVVLRNLEWPDIRQILISSLFFATAIIFWVLGLHHVTHLGVGAFINNLAIVMVPVIALFFFKEKVNRLLWVSLPLTIAGLACLFLETDLSAGSGELIFAVGAIFFAIFFNLNTRLAQRLPAMVLVTMQMLVTGLVALTISAIFETWRFQHAAGIWGFLAASILLSTCGRFVLQTLGQGMSSASHASLLMTLEPVWVALISMVWLGERMSTMQAIGCGLLFSAILLSRSGFLWRRFRRPKAVQPLS
jgi:drug/metabolite transporter (DMT)-like permease